MKGIRGSEPQGIVSDCFWVLAMYSREMTAREHQECIVRENESIGFPSPISRK